MQFPNEKNARNHKESKKQFASSPSDFCSINGRNPCTFFVIEKRLSVQVWVASPFSLICKLPPMFLLVIFEISPVIYRRLTKNKYLFYPPFFAEKSTYSLTLDSSEHTKLISMYRLDQRCITYAVLASPNAVIQCERTIFRATRRWDTKPLLISTYPASKKIPRQFPQLQGWLPAWYYRLHVFQLPPLSAMPWPGGRSWQY